jgi:hypothetical protein
MNPKIITSFFTSGGTPALGLSAKINIWSVNNIGQTLLINNASMLEVGDGFYKYYFSTYDENTDYLFRTDGGSSLASSDRYQSGANSNFADDITDAILDEPRMDHILPDSVGEGLNNVIADVTALRLDVTQMLSLVNILYKYENNRTKIDKVAKTLTVYDNNGTTVLKVFNLYDSTLTPSVLEVCERVPV